MSGRNRIQAVARKIFGTAIPELPVAVVNRKGETMGATDNRTMGVNRASSLIKENARSSFRRELVQQESFFNFRTGFNYLTKVIELQRKNGKVVLTAGGAPISAQNVLSILPKHGGGKVINFL